MATEKLFYENVYCKTFQAKVLSCAAGKHGFDVVLDKTAFYPEGGGQPGDTGYLADVRVTDTHEANGEIVHYCEKPLDVGSNVEGRIDWERRLSLMQLHSGEHILSGIVHRRFGYDNVGFHMGASNRSSARRTKSSGKTAKSKLHSPPRRSSSRFRTGAKRRSQETCGS